MLSTALDGLTVVDFTQIGAGPTATMLLADMGARVLKVEPPSGELGRGLGPAWIGDDSALFHGFNRNKYGIALDLKSPDGAAVARRLVACADVVVESMRPGVMDRLGLGREQLSRDHPDLIYCSISAYGQRGPYAGHAGVDGIVQADSGLMSLIGVEGGEPCKVQTPVVDVMTGYVAVVGILAQLTQRGRDGRGEHLDVNLLNTALALQQSSLTGYLADEQPPTRAGSAAPYSAPNQAFRTSDGWIMVAAYTPDRWRRLCAVLDLPELADDERFTTSPLRVAHRVELVQELTRAFVRRTTSTWLEVLRGADILCAPVATYPDVVNHPQVAANGMIAEVHHPTHGTLRMPGFPINSAVVNARPQRPAPACGQDTIPVLRTVGYTDDQIASMRASGAIHSPMSGPAQPAAPEPAQTAGMDVLRALHSRKSVRAYLDKPVPRHLVEDVLADAARSPSATNTQPWQVYICSGAARAELSQELVALHYTDDTPHVEQYLYYPKEWRDPYLARRRAVGKELYGLLGIPKGDKEAMRRQWARNYEFFDAPIGLFFTIERDQEQAAWLDLGMFLQTTMLAAVGHGLGTCAQQSFARYHQVIREHLEIPDNEIVVCGMSLGFPDPGAPANQLRTTREPVSAFARFVGFEDPDGSDT